MTTPALHVARSPHGAVAALRSFTARPAVTVLCDLCAAPMAEAHEHLLELQERRVVCACRACSLLFPGAGGAVYRRIESRAVRLPEVVLTGEDFRSLGVPVRLAFLGPSVVHDCVFAVYPNARGATESTVNRASWDALVHTHPSLAAIEPDVEGFFVNASENQYDAYRLSIDVCFRMVGVLRASPGRPFALRREIARVLGELDDRRGSSHA
jgi:hypothetical protein